MVRSSSPSSQTTVGAGGVSCPGQCCAFNVMPEGVMLRQKEGQVGQEERER